MIEIIAPQEEFSDHALQVWAKLLINYTKRKYANELQGTAATDSAVVKGGGR